MDPMMMQMLMLAAQNPELAATALAQSGIGPPKELVGALDRPQAAAGQPQAAQAAGAPGSPEAMQQAAGLQSLLMNSMPFVQSMQTPQMPPPPAPSPFPTGTITSPQHSQQLMQMLMAGAGGASPPSLGSLITGGQ